MLIDHAGVILFDNSVICRTVGRLAFPIFAYMLAEGCYYTKNKLRHFLEVFILGVGCQTVYFVAEGDWYLGILLTFSLAIPGVYLVYAARESKLCSVLSVAYILFIYLMCEVVPAHFPTLQLSFDYGFVGAVIPMLLAAPPRKDQKLALLTAALLLLAGSLGSDNQYYALFAVPLLFLYSGKRGKLKMKYTFYIFYPVHMALLYLLAEFI